ncbi:MAG TPA: cellulase family glycosylhydrolase [Solirubrobacteraceae bacterium]
MLAAAATLVAAAPASAGPRSSARFPESLPALSAAPSTDRGGRIVDARGREVLLRGVNVDVLADYARASSLPAVNPFTPTDLALLRASGWNLVRLQLSWSRIEPRPGQYDDAYLAEAAKYVETFRGAGIYTILDFHQDAWGASLGARPGELCPPGLQPALGWDGAPAWATLVSPLTPRCFAGSKEINPAVTEAWTAFWADARGIRTSYVAMLAYVARKLGTSDAVAGYDVMNEPGAFTAPEQAALGGLYADALRAIRGAERVAGAAPRLFLFQPDARWSALGRGAPPDFARDANVVYAPHVLSDPVSRSAFQTARDEARRFGGAPVLIGEWGATPGRGQSYFTEHQDLQDTFAMSSALWAWSEGCGSPRRLARGGSAPVLGLLDADCATGRVAGGRTDLIRRLGRAYVRATPGRLHGQRYRGLTGRFSAVGEAPAGNRQSLLVFYPGWKHRNARFRARGLANLRAVRTPGEGRFVTAIPRGPWSLEIGPRLP